jgi:hypothetical protein
MESNKRNFDDLFRDGLANHTEVPPARVWESLEQRLDARAVVSSKGWLWYAGFASVALLLGGMAINEWRNTAHDAVVAPAASVVTVAPAANDADAAANVTPSLTPVLPTPTTVGHSRKVTTPADNGGANMAREEKLTPLGNVQATGTSVHSYDDFDERAMASTQNMLKGDDAHKATGYKINKIQKHHLKAAEMVPEGGVPTPATQTAVVPGKPISMAGKASVPATRTMAARKVVSERRRAETTTQAAVLPAAGTGTVTTMPDLPTSLTEPVSVTPETTTPEVKATPVETVAISAPIASKPVLAPASRTRNTMQASAASYKPSTGGASIAGRDTMQKSEEQDASEGGKPKGLRGIFRRVLGN